MTKTDKAAKHDWLGAAACALLAWNGGAFAQDDAEVETDPMRWTETFAVGAAVVVNDEPYAGTGTTVQPIPFFLYNKGDVTIAGPNLSYRAFRPSETSLISLEGRYRFQRLDSEDSPQLAGMEDRNGTYEVGLRGQQRFGDLRIELQGMIDVAGQHDGYEVRLRGAYELGDGRQLSLRPQAGVAFQSQNILQHYFGVLADEVILTGPNARGFYEAEDGALAPFVGVSGFWRMSRRWQLQGGATVDFLPDEVTDSPVVDSDTRFGMFLGLNYLFKGPGVR